jgi:predicted DNA-binding protein
MTEVKLKASTQITFRLPIELRNRITAEAKAQSRTEANMIKIILASHFEDIDRIKKIAERK